MHSHDFKNLRLHQPDFQSRKWKDGRGAESTGSLQLRTKLDSASPKPLVPLDLFSVRKTMNTSGPQRVTVSNESWEEKHFSKPLAPAALHASCCLLEGNQPMGVQQLVTIV